MISGQFSLEFVLVLIAASFFVIGFFIYKNFYLKSESKEIDQEKIKSLEITDREYEVLKLISEGLSNKEVAEKLFLSESTIKTHVSNLLVKLNSKRRTQAIQVAQELNIL